MLNKYFDPNNAVYNFVTAFFFFTQQCNTKAGMSS